jgi:glyoxylase-like metal-dependent hydrolase (beta-lactamase superfamily II)
MKITVIQTGVIETYLHLHARPLKRDTGVRISVPVPCYLLEHNGRKVLFDAGQKIPEKEQSPLANYLVRVTPEELAVNRLAEMGIFPEDLDYIILSHHHGDHCDGLKDFPQAKVVCQRAALENLKRFPNSFQAVDGEYDVWGDGSIICVPTPGHAPGHQSLLVTGDDGSKTLLLGDVVYMPESLDYSPTCQEYAERPDYFDSIRKVRTLRDNGVKIIFGHHPFLFL